MTPDREALRRAIEAVPAINRSYAAFTDDSGYQPHTNLVSVKERTDCVLSIPGRHKREPIIEFLGQAHPNAVKALLDNEAAQSARADKAEGDRDAALQAIGEEARLRGRAEVRADKAEADLKGLEHDLRELGRMDLQERIAENEALKARISRLEAPVMDWRKHTGMANPAPGQWVHIRLRGNIYPYYRHHEIADQLEWGPNGDETIFEWCSADTPAPSNPTQDQEAGHAR